MGLSEEHAKALEDRGIDVEIAVKLGVETSNKLGSNCIVFPYFQGGVEVNHKYRTIGGEKKFCQDAGAVKCFWNVDVLADDTLNDAPLIITEGEFDALVAMQCGHQRVMSVPDGAPAEAQGENDSGAKYSYVEAARAALRDVKEIILCTDSDGPGVNLMHDLSHRLGRARCKFVKYPKGCKDLNDTFSAYGKRGVDETIQRAQWIKVDGVYRMDELPPSKIAKVHQIGIPGLENHYKIRPGDFCVVTGVPSHGKSSFINDVACNMAMKYSWKTAFASFEQRPQVDHKRALRTWYGRAPAYKQTEEELQRADEWINKQFAFIVPDEDDDVTLAWVLERCSAAIVQHGAKLVVIDPWNEMDHIRPRDMNLTEYTGFAIKQFRKLASKHQVHVIVAAHPTKMRKTEDGSIPMPSLYDISDSAHWYNKADVGIIIHRVGSDTVIRVAKSRYHDLTGEPGDVTCRFSTHDNRYDLVSEADEEAA